jgi:translation initiation factor 1
LPLHCATFPSQAPCLVALPLPEWGFAVGCLPASRYPDPYEEKPVVKKASSFSALGGLVYSTDAGRHCPDCGQPVAACICKQSRIPEGDGFAGLMAFIYSDLMVPPLVKPPASRTW